MPKGIYERQIGRYPYGSRTLSPKDDLEIQSLYNKGMSQTDLKKKFQVGKRTISNSLRRTETPRIVQQVREKNPAWKGGRILDCDGYVLIRLFDHPQSRNGYVREHRIVMEKMIGRYLLPEEVVHHKNHKRDDNRSENLLLFSDNGTHLGVELLGKCPKWSKDGRQKIVSRSIPSMKGIHQCPNGTGVRTLRKKLIQKFLHETSDLQNTEPVVKLVLPPSYRRKK